MTFQKLVGQKLASVDVINEREIRFTTDSGLVVLFYHEQDCCENVRLITPDGDVKQLVGRCVLEVKENIVRIGDDVDDNYIIGKDVPDFNPKYAESWTDTRFEFITDEGTEVIRWFGESNGYYSESIRVADITDGRFVNRY